jgi:hypothetical protein
MPTDLEINRAVSLKFGIWKEGESCKGFVHAYTSLDLGAVQYCTKHHTFDAHSNVPDLLSSTGADLLMTALLRADRNPRFNNHFEKGISCEIETDIYEVPIEELGPTWIHALRDAAYKLCEVKA